MRTKPGALAYHDLTPKDCRFEGVREDDDRESRPRERVGVARAVEMLVDPAINMMSTGPTPRRYMPTESADPVEALSFKVRGHPE